MKKSFLLILVFGAFCSYVSAQDTIVLVNGDKLITKVVEMNADIVTYKDFSKLDGVNFMLSTKEISSVHFFNSSVKTFNETPDDDVYINDVPVRRNDSRAMTGSPRKHEFEKGYSNSDRDMLLNMSYREKKQIYSYKNYRARYDDPYNVAVAGIASYFIPGLGQMISGEVGRGFAFLGGTVGSYCVGYIGLGLVMGGVGYDYDYYYYDDGLMVAGSIMTVVGFLSGLTLNICSIVDAIRVAKVNNMHRQDLMNNQISFQLKPYVGTPNQFSVVKDNPVGLTLSLNF
ncbi:MAG: hypothetical protein ACK5KP_12335 [Paludibacteraceae bacterium]